MNAILIRKRLLIYAAAGFCLVLAAIGYYEFVLRLPVGSGPAGPMINGAEFGKPWKLQPVFVVGVGDSVTAGFGARRGYSYFDRLITNPPAEFPEMEGISLARVFPVLRSTNLAMSGSTSLQGLQAEFKRVGVQGAGVLGIVVMTTGGNDIIHDYGRTLPRETAMYGATFDQAAPWIGNFPKRLESMYEALDRSFPGGFHLYIANIYDPTDGVGDPQRVGLPRWQDNQRILSAYNAAIAEFAQKRKENVHMVDIHSAFLGHGIHCREFWRSCYSGQDPHYWYHENLEDPNERGYDALRRLFLQKMVETLKN